MPAVGKELEHPVSQEVPAQPIEQVPFVEKVERQVEVAQPVNQQTQKPPVEVEPIKDDMGTIVAKQFAVQARPNIVLPMSEKEMTEGRHKRVWSGMRWAYEWCIMMIKKYPGRVFYLPPETR